MRDACVLVHFAKQILTVDKLKRSPPERLELQPETGEFMLRNIRDGANDVSVA
jgi:hypothetical protein